MIIHGKGGHGRVVAAAAKALRIDFLHTDSKDGFEPSPASVVHPAIGDNKARSSYRRFPLASIIHPSAIIDPSCTIGEGTFCGAGCVVQTNAKVGQGCIINTRSVIEHDCVLGNWCHVAPGAVLCGAATLGEGVFIGANSVVKQGITIAPWTVIGCGAAVVKDIIFPGTYIGVPAELAGGD